MSNVPFKTSLAPPPFIEVPVSSQESEWSYICLLGVSCIGVLGVSYICLLGVSILPLYTILIFHFHFINSLILIKYMCVKNMCFRCVVMTILLLFNVLSLNLGIQRVQYK